MANEYTYYHLSIVTGTMQYSRQTEYELDAYRDMKRMARLYDLSDKDCTIDRVTVDENGVELNRWTIF